MSQWERVISRPSEYQSSSELSVLKLITVKLPEAILEGLNELVKAGMYQNRSAAIRAAVRDMLKKELWRTEES
jgi:Arc/MetJ-type ribon-helix-helix transcriptional regulator